MSPPRVLVVDDEPAQRQVFTRLLDARGFQPLAAASAAEALQKLSAAVILPHLMLIDISMPGMDGITLMKALRAHPATALIPMILMSGLAVPTSLMEAASASLGAGPIFFKGADQDTLLSRIRRALGSPAPSDAGANAPVIDPVKRTVLIGDRLLPRLPAQRFQILCALARTPHPVSREELLSLVWEGSDNVNLVDVTIGRLRRDLRAFSELSIETTPGGYRLVVGARRGRLS